MICDIFRMYVELFYGFWLFDMYLDVMVFDFNWLVVFFNGCLFIDDVVKLMVDNGDVLFYEFFYVLRYGLRWCEGRRVLVGELFNDVDLFVSFFYFLVIFGGVLVFVEL